MTRVARSAMLGFALGWVIAVAGACGGNKACGPGTCDGCCDAAGVCQQGTSDSSCGDNGATCSACTAPQACLAGACGALGPADGGGGSPATFTEWCDTFSVSYCHALVTCKQVSEADEAHCVKLFKDLGCAQNREGILQGYSTFDRAAGGSCLSQLQTYATTCDDTSFSCEVAVPASTVGEGCSSPSDCVGTDLGCGGPACNQTCQPAGGYDQACRDGWSCNDGLWCDSATTTCRGPKPLGATCDASRECGASAYCSDTTWQCTALPTSGQPCANYTCADGSYCDPWTDTCLAKQAVGASCSWTDQCVDTAYCNFNAFPSVCSPRKSIASMCTSSDECQQGAYCDGVCKPQVTEGGACKAYDACADGLTCDDVSRTCSTHRTVGEGQPCTDSMVTCDWGLNCRGAVTNPDGGVGTMGTCQAPALGDSCGSSYDCPQGAFCRMPTDGGWEGTCATSSLGSPCTENDDCQTGQYCNRPSWGDGTCATQAGLAQPCDNNNWASCASPYTCKVNGSITVCGERGGAGAPCTDSDDCTYFNECRNNVCTAVSFQGQPCTEYGFCYDGECVGRDLDAGTSGTCGGKLADGEACYLASQCQSSNCLGSICASCP